MWGNKKPDAPQPGQPEQRNPISNQPSRPAPAAWEEKPAMSTDAMRPLGGTADRGTARLGASLHVKGEISGNEDLVIDGSVEGLVQLDERKLTVGATAKVTAYIIAREARLDDQIGDFHIPRGTAVIVSPWLAHRHRSLWPEPDRFDPTRFLQGDRISTPPSSASRGSRTHRRS